MALPIDQAPGARRLLHNLNRAEEFLVPYQDRMIGGGKCTETSPCRTAVATDIIANTITVDLARKLSSLCMRLITEVKNKLEDLEHIPSNDTISRELKWIVFRDMQPILDDAEAAACVAKAQAHAAAAAAERQAAKATHVMKANLPDWEPRDPESSSVASDVWSVASKADARSKHEEFEGLIKVIHRTQLRVDELFPSRLPFLAPSPVKDFRRALKGAEALFLKYRYRKIAVGE